MAASMQYDDASGGKGLQRVQHGAKINAVRACVIVGVGVHRKARVLKERAMVFPTRIRNPHLGLRKKTPQKISADLERTGAPKRLHRNDAIFLHRHAVAAE